jgi:E3 ubiquitin-protein ligase RNF144
MKSIFFCGLSKKNTFMCEICRDCKSSKKIFKYNDRCAHDSICSDCIIKLICIKVKDKVAEIKCPYWECKQLLDPHTCWKIIPKILFSEWCDLLCYLALQPYEIMNCPNRKCSELVVNECGGIVQRSECPKCKQLFCFRCKLPWPECNNCQITEENDKLFMGLAKRKKWIKCPTCNYYVERINGCNRIICRFDFSLLSH